MNQRSLAVHPTIGWLITIALGIVSLGWPSWAASEPRPPAAPVRLQVDPAAPTMFDIVVRFTATDGTPLEAKLTVPAEAKGPVPVVFKLHGAGPRNYDHFVQYRDAGGQLQVLKYYDSYAGELARRGVAFFRMSKRGCTNDPKTGRPLVDRAVFSKATPSVLLDDYAKGLEALRARKDIDATRIVLWGSSEGTRLAPSLALRSPGGIVGLVLASYAADNTRETVVWQTSVGPWRNVQKLIPAAADGVLTREEHAAAVTRDATLGTRLPFPAIDLDADGAVTADEMTRVVRPRLEAILRAVEARDDDFIWQTLLNLTSAYLREEWDGAPTSATLLKLNVPIAIFHGELDGTTRVEGVRETEAAFRAAGKTNLIVNIYPDHDHDLNWTVESSKNGGPVPFQDAFAFVTRVTASR